MPRKNAPEFFYDEKKRLYRKRIKNPNTNKWTSVYGKTKEECRKKAKQKAEAFKQAAVTAANPYVFQYAAQWYRLNTGDLGQKRKDDYRNAINNHICPVIGSLHMQEVTPDDIQTVMAEAAGLSNSAQQKIVTTLKRIFKAAERNGTIPKSPCEDLVAGGKETQDKDPLSKEQQQKLISAVRGTKAELFVLLALYAGLRREEALAMQWDCVHLDAVPPYISVRRALRWDGKNAPIISEELKSKAAARDIPIPQQLIDGLTKAKPPKPEGMVIANSRGEAMSAASFRRMWDVIRVRSERIVKEKTTDGKIVEKQLKIGDKIRNHDIRISLDFHVSPHQLRHTYITELILAGANIKVVQYLAGHKTVQLTLDIYTKLMENKPKDTAPAVELAFGVKNGVTAETEGQKNTEE